MSYRSLKSHPLNSSVKSLLKKGAHLSLGVGAFTPILALANPSGGQVVAGQATIGTPSANGMVINQASQSAIINWQQFNIGKGQYVQFLQPSSSAVVLNRVVGGSPSSILGTLSANGQVFLVNTNGVFFGKGASIDVQGFLASTIDITDANFLSGNYVFDHGGSPDAKLVNQGRIRAHNGGYVVLAGDYAENTGIISAQSGHVILAAGSKATLDLNGNKLVHFAIDQATLSNYAGVKNAGSLIADGGTVIMTADVANALKATVVNNTGLIEAKSLTASKGHIYLTATGGNIENGGQLTAAADHGGIAGGDIILKGDGRTTLTQASVIDASGQGAKGGHLEVSGDTIKVRGIANLGHGGDLLLDPGHMQIVTGSGSSLGNPSNSTSAGTIGVNFIQTQLNGGNDVTIEAENLVDASSNVHAITATVNAANGGGGGLEIDTGTNGTVNLKGVSINIAGAFTASMGYGSFGFLQAGSIDLTGTNPLGWVHLSRASSAAGVITKYSARATKGHLTITGPQLSSTESGGGAGLALKAKTDLNLGIDIGGVSTGTFGGDVTLVGANVSDGGHLIHANGDVHVTGSNGYVNLGDVHAQSDVTITDLTGKVFVDTVNAGHDVAINAKGQTLSFGTASGTIVNAGNDVSLTAKTIQQGGDAGVTVNGGAILSIAAGGDITIKGAFALNARSSSSPFTHGVGHHLQLSADGNIKTDHSLVNGVGGISIIGDHLIYTGKGKTFTVSAGFGDLILDASIGSANAGVKYNVNLVDQNHGLYIERSIYTGSTAQGAAANIIATQGGTHSGSGGFGVYVGSGESGNVTLSAKGNATLTGRNVRIGDIDPGTEGKVTIKAGGDVGITANGSGSTGTVYIRAENATASNDSVDRSILIQAGGNLGIHGRAVTVNAGGAVAHAGGFTNATAKANASVTLKAGGNVGITAEGAANISASIAFANALGSSGLTRTATADASVNITAGKAITITGNNVRASAGYGVAQASAGEGAIDTAIANANINLKAGTRIGLDATGSASNGQLIIHGGNNAGSNGYALNNGSGKAAATAHADVNLTAKTSIGLQGKGILVAAGDHAGFASFGTAVRANGGSATLVTTANVNLTAKTGISITGSAASGQLLLRGGSVAGSSVRAAADFGTASEDIQAHLSVSAGGDLTITGHDILIHGGSAAGANALGSAAEGGQVSIAVDAGVDIHAGGALTATGHNVILVAGNAAARGAKAVAAGLGFSSSSSSGFRAVADVAADAGISISAGSATLEASNALSVSAGDSGARLASASANSGSATVTGKSNLDITTGGALKLLGHGSLLFIGAGNSVAGGSVSNSSAGPSSSGSQVFRTGAAAFGGAASVTGAGNLNITGGSVTVTADTGAVVIDGGYGAGHLMAVVAGSGGSAAVDAQAAVSITATAGNIALRGHTQAQLQAGSNVGGGESHGFDRGGSLGSSVFSIDSGFVTNYAQAQAGAGAKSSLSANAGISLSATGTLSLTQDSGSTGALNVDAGNNVGRDVRTLASAGGSVDVDLRSAVSIQAGGKVSLTGRNVFLQGGNDAMDGAFGAVHVTGSSQCTSSGCTRTTSSSFTSPDGQTAKGAGSKVNLNGDASLSIKGGSVAVTAGSHLGVNGGDNGAGNALISGSNGGAAVMGVKGGVTMTATGAMTLKAGHSLDISGAHGSGESATVAAGGNNASAKLTTTGGVNLAGATVGLTAGSAEGGTASIGINGGGSAGYGAQVFANNNAKAALIGNGGVNITVKSGFSAMLLGSRASSVNAIIRMGNGSNLGSSALASAGTNGVASIKEDSGININVTASGGTLTLSTGNNGNGAVSIGDAGSLGYGAQVRAFHGTASMDVSGNVNLAAKGAVTIDAVHAAIRGGNSNGSQVSVSADAGGKATLHARNSISIAGGAISLDAGNLVVTGGGQSNGRSANVQAQDGGSASLDISAVTTLKATAGALTLHAEDGMSIAAGQVDNGLSASVSASAGDARATMNLNDSVVLAATGAVHLTAGGDMSIGGNTAGGAGLFASITAGAHASATMNQAEKVSISAGGALTIAAGSKLSVSGADSLGRSADAIADGAGAKAAYNGDGTLTLSGNTVKLSASSMFVDGGSRAGSSGYAGATHGGSASLKTDAGLRITAVNGFSAKLTGVNSGSSQRDLEIYSGGRAGENALASTSNAASKALVNAASGVDISVTAATGTVSITTGTVQNTYLYLGGSNAAGRDAQAQAHGGGIATVTVDNDFNLSAKGAVTIAAANGSASLVAAYDSNGVNASASASGAGKAAMTIGSSLNITGGSVTVTAGKDLLVIAARDSNGRSMDVSAHNGGSANVTLNAGLGITATGVLKMTAGSDMAITAAQASNGRSVDVQADHGGAKANAKVNSALLLSGKTGISLAAGNNLSLNAGSAEGDNGSSASVDASFGGRANFTDNQTATIVTNGAFSAKAGEELQLFGASSFGRNAHVTASRGSAKAGATFDGTLSVKAGSVALAAGSTLNVFGGYEAGSGAAMQASFGGSAQLTAATGVQIDAKNAVTLTLTGTGSGGNIGISGGGFAAGDAFFNVGSSSGGGRTGKVGMTVDSGVDVNVSGATGAITLNAGSHDGASVYVGGAFAPAGSLSMLMDGGSAALTADGSVNLSARGAVTLNAGADGNLTIYGAGGAAHNAGIGAASGAHASVTTDNGATLSGGTVTLNAGADVGLFGGGVSDGRSVGIHAASSGSASLNLKSGVTITATGLLTAKAGGNLNVTANSGSSLPGNIASHASVTASHSATALLTGSNTVSITAAAVSLTAGDNLAIAGAAAQGRSAAVIAINSSDHAAMALEGGVDITATGAVTLTAGGNISLFAGSQAALGVVVAASHALASATVSVDDSVKIQAGGAFKAVGASFSASGGGGMGVDAEVSAFGSNAHATLDLTGKVSVAASGITVTAASGGVDIGGASAMAQDASISALEGGTALFQGDGGIALSATGAIKLTANGGDVQVTGGSGNFIFGMPTVRAGLGSSPSLGSGTASYVNHSAVSLHAGTVLTVKATDNVFISGGFAQFVNLEAANGGAANASIDAGIKLSAGGKVSLTATTGSLEVFGGGVNGILANVFSSAGGTSSAAGIPPGPSGGILTGTLDTAVSITGGSDVALKAGGDVIVGAGLGANLQVGAWRVLSSSGGLSFLGAAWGGGSANLSANMDATISAGHNLVLTAGTGGSGDLQVNGLGQNLASSFFINEVAVRGGSSNAVANLSLDGNATLSAANDIVLNAAGNASIVGGAVNNVRADHTRGDISLTGSANASMHAGHDVVINKVTGSLTVAGTGVNSSHSGFFLVDAFGSTGQAATVGHGDAAIVAGNDIRTVNALGGDLNVVAGQSMFVVALGSNTDASNTATGTADASLSAGHNVTVVAAGDLNVLGGARDSASAAPGSNAGSIGSLHHTADISVTAGISGLSAVNITVGGSAVIAGGDSLAATAKNSGGGLMANNATADASVLLSGHSLTLAVGGSLLVRGGSSVNANALVSSAGAITANATAKANATLSAAGNVTITVGTGGSGTASFIGGSGAHANAVAIGGSIQALAQTEANVAVNAGGSLTITAKGDLNVTGGPAAQNSASILAGIPGFLLPSVSSAPAADIPAFHANATGTVGASATFTAGANLTLKAGGNVNILGGSHAGTFAFVTAAGSDAHADLSVDTSVTVHAGGAVKVNSGTAGSVNIFAGSPASPSSGPFVFTASSGSGLTAHAAFDSSVTITGHSVNVNSNHNVNTSPGFSFSSSSPGGFSLTIDATVTIVPALHLASVLAPHSVSPQDAVFGVSLRSLSSVGGGAIVTPSLTAPVSFSLGQARVEAGPVTGLDTLQSQSLVMHLETLLAAPQASGEGAAVFTPAGGTRYLGSLEGSCKARWSKLEGGQYRCSAGGK